MTEIALRQIRAIIAVCEEGSFTRAAVRENATQSGISQNVAAVERTLGVKLFDRSVAGRDAERRPRATTSIASKLSVSLRKRMPRFRLLPHG